MIQHELVIDKNQFNNRIFSLSGVDFERIEIDDWWTTSANCMRIVLDGVTFNILEDPDDGYRSMLNKIYIGGKVKNTFSPVKVLGRHYVGEDGEWYTPRDNIMQLVDIKNKRVVVEFGTHNYDNWYPCFVARFIPENMHIKY